jgi:DNA-binding transcriptional ArsR family regulator
MTAASAQAVGSPGSDGPSGSGDSPESDADPGEIDRDDLFHILRNQRRRFALHHLKHNDDPVDVGTLATQVAAWENEVSVEEVTSVERRRVYNALQQTHIPELEETGVVAVDRRDVELTDRAEELDIYLEVVPGEDIPWSEYYLGLAAVSLAALAAVGFGIGPFATVSGVGAGVFVAVAFLASAAANYYSQHESLVGGGERPPELRGE